MKLENALSSARYMCIKDALEALQSFARNCSIMSASHSGAEPKLFTIHMASRAQATGEADG